jgi:hypothetical protein
MHDTAGDAWRGRKESVSRLRGSHVASEVTPAAVAAVDVAEGRVPPLHVVSIMMKFRCMHCDANGWNLGKVRGGGHGAKEVVARALAVII